MSAKKKSFSWSVFGAAVLGTLAAAVVAGGVWFWITKSGEIDDPDLKDRFFNLWVMLAIFLTMISLGMYLLPKRHARWMSPIQKGVILALLAHIILILVTRMTQVSTDLTIDVATTRPTIQLKTASEVMVAQEIRKQASALPIPDPTAAQPVQVDQPLAKPVRPKTPEAQAPKAEAQMTPLEVKAAAHQAAKSAEEALKAAPKLEAQSPELAKQAMNPLSQKEKQANSDKPAPLLRASTPEPTANAAQLQQQVQRAQPQRVQISPSAQPWKPNTGVAENSAVKPDAQAQPSQSVDANVANQNMQQVSAREQKAQAGGTGGNNTPGGHSRLAGQYSPGGGSAQSVQIAQTPGQAGGTSIVQNAGGGTGSTGMTGEVEGPPSVNVAGPAGGGGQVQTSGLPVVGGTGSGRVGQSEVAPSAGGGGSPGGGQTRLGNTGTGGGPGGPGDVGVGTGGAAQLGSGGTAVSSVVAAAGGGSGTGALGSAAEGAGGGAGTGPVVRDAPEVPGPPGTGTGSAGSGGGTGGGTGPGSGGGNAKVAVAESTVGAQQAQAVSGQAYAGRQQVGGPSGSISGDVLPSGAPVGAMGPQRGGSLLPGASDVGSPRGVIGGTGEAVAAGGGSAPAGGAVDVAGVPGGMPGGTGTGVRGSEGSLGSAVGGPGTLAGRVTTGGGGGSGGTGKGVGDVTGGGAGASTGVGGGSSIGTAAGGGGGSRGVPGGEVGGGAAVPVNTAITMPEFKPAPEALPQPQALAHRTEPIRKQNVEIMGGSQVTEAAVAESLNFLSRCQEPDGRWTHFTGGPKPGQNKPSDHDMALTGLATLCFLATDATPNKPGPYQEHVRKSLAYLVSHQKPDGGMRGEGDMYDHGMATLAMVEAAVMSNEDMYRESAIRAVRFTIAAQNAQTGGWRYKPGDEGDTSIFGWQVLGIYSVRHLGLKVPDATMWGALRWLDSVASRTPQRALSGYTDRIPQPAMSAEAAFCRMLLGQKLSAAQQQELSEYLLHFEPGKGRNDLLGRDDFYMWYYTALCLAQLQNDAWTAWNQKMQARLLPLQRKDGEMKGSWDPNDKHSRLGGRVYTTVLGTLTLEVYYRYLPIFARPKGYVAPAPPKASK